jgi:hypothetical protein
VLARSFGSKRDAYLALADRQGRCLQGRRRPSFDILAIDDRIVSALPPRHRLRTVARCRLQQRSTGAPLVALRGFARFALFRDRFQPILTALACSAVHRDRLMLAIPM